MTEDPMSTDNVVRIRMLTHNSRLVDARKAKGFTQPTLAALVGRPVYYISGIENLRILPSNQLMMELSDVLEQPVHYLFPYSLIQAIKAGVFEVRTAEISPPHLSYLTDRVNAGLLSDGGDGAQEIEDEMDRALLEERIDEVLHELTERQRRVIELRFGLKDGKERTLEEIGLLFNVQRERIRQIEGKALRRLRHPVHSRKLKGYLK